MCRAKRARKEVNYSYDDYDEQIRKAVRGPKPEDPRKSKFWDPRCRLDPSLM